MESESYRCGEAHSWSVIRPSDLIALLKYAKETQISHLTMDMRQITHSTTHTLQTESERELKAMNLKKPTRHHHGIFLYQGHFTLRIHHQLA